jgi:hypothetical protein
MLTREDGGEVGNTSTLLVKCTSVQPLWKSVRRVLKKAKTELPYDSATLLLVIEPMERESTLNNTDTFIFMFIAALFTIAKLWNHSRYLTTNE